MKNLFFVLFVTFFSSDVFSGDTELISDKLVNYFKAVSSSRGKPISLKVTLTDSFGSGASIQDERELNCDTFPKFVSKKFVMDILEEKEDFLKEFIEGKDPHTLSLKATIWINGLSDHREKVNGFCSLGE